MLKVSKQTQTTLRPKGLRLIFLFYFIIYQNLSMIPYIASLNAYLCIGQKYPNDVEIQIDDKLMLKLLACNVLWAFI